MLTKISKNIKNQLTMPSKRFLILLKMVQVQIWERTNKKNQSSNHSNSSMQMEWFLKNHNNNNLKLNIPKKLSYQQKLKKKEKFQNQENNHQENIQNNPIILINKAQFRMKLAIKMILNMNLMLIHTNQRNLIIKK